MRCDAPLMNTRMSLHPLTVRTSVRAVQGALSAMSAIALASLGAPAALADEVRELTEQQNQIEASLFGIHGATAKSGEFNDLTRDRTHGDVSLKLYGGPAGVASTSAFRWSRILSR